MMNRTALRWFITVGVAISLTAHLFALVLGWYGTVGAIDTYLHFFGGTVVVTFLLYWALERSPHLLRGPWHVQWGVFVGLALLAGVFWEIFEYTFDSYWGHLIASGADRAQPSLDDTMHDLIVYTIGGLLGLLLFWRRNSVLE